MTEAEKKEYREALHLPGIVVTGSGMAWFGSTYRFQAEDTTPVIFEESSRHGGHPATFRNDSGLLFDIGPRISFGEVVADGLAVGMFTHKGIHLDSAITYGDVELLDGRFCDSLRAELNARYSRFSARR